MTTSPKSSRLLGRSAIITGGSRGIGAAIALAFAREGANVAICHDDDDAGAGAMIEEIYRLGCRVRVPTMRCRRSGGLERIHR